MLARRLAVESIEVGTQQGRIVGETEWIARDAEVHVWTAAR